MNDSESIIEIMNALPFNTHLIKLGISTMDLMKEAWVAFDDALCRNFVLQELGDVKDYPFYDEEIENIASPLLRVCYGTRNWVQWELKWSKRA